MILAALGAWLAGFEWPAVVGVMALALVIAWVVEWFAWQTGPGPAAWGRWQLGPPTPTLDLTDPFPEPEHTPAPVEPSPVAPVARESELPPRTLAESRPEPSTFRSEPPPSAEPAAAPPVARDPQARGSAETPSPPKRPDPHPEEAAVETEEEGRQDDSSPAEASSDEGESFSEEEAAPPPLVDPDREAEREGDEAPPPVDAKPAKPRRSWFRTARARPAPSSEPAAEPETAGVGAPEIRPVADESEPAPTHAEAASPPPAPPEAPPPVSSPPRSTPRPRAVPPPPPPSPRPPSAPTERPQVVRMRPRRTEPREWNLWELESLARGQGRAEPGRGEEWSYLFLHLRQFADAKGTLPTEFDGLVRESFGELLETLGPV